jgi:twinkle protein
VADEVVQFPRYGQSGYYALAQLPQRAPLSQSTISTGWPELDEVYKLYPGQFTVTTGKPGHGKSTLWFNIICNIAKRHGMRTFMYVPENERSVVEKLQRIWGDDPGFDYFAEEQCYVQSGQDAYTDFPKTLPWVLQQAVNAIEKDKVELVFIDPWNWIERAKPKDQLLTDYISECLGLVKLFAGQFNVMVCLVAHPTKAVNEAGGRTATLADIEGSMSWWNKSDNGLIVVRDVQLATTKVISAKVREEPEAGQLGIRNFWVDRNTGLFTPLVGAASGYEPQRPDTRPYSGDRGGDRAPARRAAYGGSDPA